MTKKKNTQTRTLYEISSYGDAAQINLKTPSKKLFNSHVKWLAKNGIKQRTSIRVIKTNSYEL